MDEKIITLNKLNEEYKEVIRETNDLFQQLSDKLLGIMEKYKPIAQWYVEKGFYYDPHHVRQYIPSQTIILAYSENEDIVYFWDPFEKGIRSKNLRDNQVKVCNPYIFVSKGYFEEAYKNIAQLDDAMDKLLKQEIERKKKIESILEKY